GARGERRVHLLLLGGVGHPLDLELLTGLLGQAGVHRAGGVRGGRRMQQRHPAERAAAAAFAAAAAATGRERERAGRGDGGGLEEIPASDHAGVPFVTGRTGSETDDGRRERATVRVAECARGRGVVWGSSAEEGSRSRRIREQMAAKTAAGRPTPNSASSGTAKRSISP